ncbi:MAG TPA: multicopper oxidase domain-containing protein [Candidatus Elarobacter sp.]|jgi:FtsP/CotA-like multicopper oxidase with cupredoxin domain
MTQSRGVFVLSIAALAALAVAAALPAGPARPAGAAAAVPGDCTPHPNGNLVEDPPVVANPHGFTLYVMTDASGTHYCYKQHPADRYVEAPTIVVHNHDAFDFRLVNTLPHPGPRPSPYAFQGNCPVLPAETPTPMPQRPTGEDFSASPLPTPFLSYLNHQRSVDPVMPSGMPMPGMNPGDTNVHTHGLDTNPLEDNVFKSTVASKDGSCRYHIALYPNQHAGTYWYHAHLHGLAEEQVSGGLAGALIVLPNPPESGRIGRVLLVKDHVKAGDTSEARQKTALFAPRPRLGAVAAASAAPAPPNALTPVPNVDPADPPAWHSPTALGPASTDCHGATPAPNATFEPIQINGVQIPNPGENRPVPVTYQAVAQERYRIIDGMADGYLNLKLFETVGGKQVPRKLVVIARDGVDVGKNALAVYRDQVLVPPAGRLDIDVAQSKNPLTLVADGDFCSGNNGDYTPRREILRILPAPPPQPPGAKARTAAINARARTSAPAPRVAQPGQTDADRFLQLALKTQAAQPHRVITFQQYWTTGNSGFYVTETSGADPMRPRSVFTERPFWLAPAGVKGGYVMPTIRVHKKQIEHWTLVNAATQIHAFHIHQLTFVTLNNPFEPEQSKVFEDTTPLHPAMPCVMHGSTCVPRPPNSTEPATMALPTKTQIEIDFSKVPSGTWVFHCHMLFHEDHGMMGIIQVD